MALLEPAGAGHGFFDALRDWYCYVAEGQDSMREMLAIAKVTEPLPVPAMEILFLRSVGAPEHCDKKARAGDQCVCEDPVPRPFDLANCKAPAITAAEINIITAIEENSGTTVVPVIDISWVL